jgi:predicted 3-demethylubiquinone-9 3-methyltransferase (glyoxalase superfamily)
MSFFVPCASAVEVDRLYAALADGGSVLMELDSYPFAQRYAWVQDRFGVSWQLIFGQA